MDTHAQDARAGLYEAHRSAVYRTCLGLLGSPDEAADATQEVFAKVLPVIPEVRHPRAWLQTAARHHCTDILRRRRLAERTGAPDWGVEREAPDPAEVVERRHAVARAMSAMSSRERRVLTQAFLEDAPLGEVAACMGLSYAATVQLLSRARRHAAHLVNLPSAVVGPKLAALARLVTRGPLVQTTVPRGPATGGVLLLCVSLLCNPTSTRATPGVAPPPPALQGGSAAATPDSGARRPLAIAAPVPVPQVPQLGAVLHAAPEVTPAGSACIVVPDAPPTQLWTHAAGTPSPTTPPPPPQLRLVAETMWSTRPRW